MGLAKILVATDFSPAALRAIERAAYLASQAEAELQLVHVLPEESFLKRLFHNNNNTLSHEQMLRGAEQALQAACNGIERTHKIDATWEVVKGRAQHMICKAADKFSTDLVVIGAHGEHESSRGPASMGGTALKLLTHCRTPLLLVRRPAKAPYGRLILAIEGGKAARRLLDMVEMFPSPNECHVLHAFEPPFEARLRALQISPDTLEIYAIDQRAAEEREIDSLICDSICKDILHPLVVRGEASACILREIERLQPDLVAIGKHGQRARRRARKSEPGSVALRIAFAANCDILQVP